ncbi:MAG: type VII secretion protein EccB [Actinomycetota bacterium]|nr:type VII secretion protein EccB [Actinomycetota bacterium]
MARNPTTKAQVQAYQFLLRRMESALVRKDPVMLHEPMRTHTRAVIVGAILGALGLAAFFVVGLFAPDDDLTSAQIVVGKQSGAVYVVQQAEPVRLVPVRNLASARLLLVSPAFTGDAGPAGPAEVRVVEDSSLADAPRAPLTGIEGAPAYLPGPDRQVEPDWAVCDAADLNASLPNPEAAPEVTTTALVGVPRPGDPLGPGRALLVQSPEGTEYLVFGGRRAAVDRGDTAVRNAFRLSDVVPRPVSAGLLNAIPASRALVAPDVAGADEPVLFSRLSSQRVGDVVKVERAGGEEFFVLLRDGKQQVERAVADLLRFDRSDKQIPLVSLEDIGSVPDAPPAARIEVGGFPATVPEIVPTAASRVACLTWSMRGDKEPRTAITISEEITLDEGMTPVRVPSSGPGSGGADQVFVPPSRGALVRGVVPGQEPGSGSIFLVTDLGFRYGVPSLEIAAALGLGETTQPAPEAVLDLLPIGPSLDPQIALQLFDPELAAEQLAEQLADR